MERDLTQIAALRQEYRKARLERRDLDANPLRQCALWLEEALRAELPEPTAMTLATVDAAGRPSARIVLLKGIEDGGFHFFTNYQSRKGQELEASGKAALVLFWPEVQRQVRIGGRVERLAEEVSDTYYGSRPRGSQLGAWSSPQSEVIPNRSWLEARLADVEERFEGGSIPRPETWGGYRVEAEEVEFWQGRESRLHDRFRYLSRTDGGWELERLAP